MIDEQVNNLIDKAVSSGAGNLSFDFEGYQQIITDQKQDINLIKRKLLIYSIVIVLANLGLTVLSCKYTYVKNFGFLGSFIGAILVLFISLGKIATTIKSVQNAFPNERFVWTNVWNLIIFTLLNLILFVLNTWSELLMSKSGVDPNYEETYWRLSLTSLVFFVAQYAFGLYMDMFLFYLVLKFTKVDQQNSKRVMTSIAFFENQA